MSRSVIHCAVIAVAGSAFSFNAFAQATASFESLDANKDGKISIHEATSNDDLFTAFKNLDKNKDGELTKEEFAAYKK
jgi:Ca2+-binding EF-hand superfamily protein